MLREIAAKDFTELRRDGRLFVAGGLVVVLLLAALWVGWERQREVAAERVIAQQLDYDDWVSQPERHPHTAAHQGMHVFKPDPPLSIVDPGIGPFVGSAIWLQAHRQSELKFRPAQDATGLQRFGELSPAWVLQTLGPLLVIVLGFNALAGERERGTMRQTLSLGVSATRLMWGKALALLVALSVLLVPAALVATIGVAAGSGWGWDALARLALLAVGYGLYLAIAVFVVLAVSAWAPSSRLALVTLLGLWIVGVLLAPRIASDLSRTWYPSPSRLMFNSSLDGDIDAAASRAWLENLGVAVRWDPKLPLDKWGIALQVDDHAGYGVIDRHFEDLWDTFDRQQRAQEQLGLAVPILAVRAFSMGIVGTDFAHHRAFSVAAEQQRRAIQDVVSHYLVQYADPRGAGHFDYRSTTGVWAKVPRFNYDLPSVGWALRNSAQSFIVLAGTLALAIAAAHVAVRRRRTV